MKTERVVFLGKIGGVAHRALTQEQRDLEREIAEEVVRRVQLQETYLLLAPLMYPGLLGELRGRHGTPD